VPKLLGTAVAVAVAVAAEGDASGSVVVVVGGMALRCLVLVGRSGNR